MIRPTFTGILFTFALYNLVIGLTGCTNQPTEAELTTLRQEAIAQNAAIAARPEKDLTTLNWQFVVQGQTLTGKPVEFSLAKLDAIATQSVWTQDPHNTNDPNAVVHFRGIPVSKLLDEFGVAPNVTEVTFVAYDAYRVTVSLADLRQYPIIIALERNNQKISQNDGGPLYLVFPYSKFPQLQTKYGDPFWAFYLTGMVVGTEPIHLEVSETSTEKTTQGGAVPRERVFNSAALAKLPQVTLEESVEYRSGWPAGKVKLHGVRLRDALAAARLRLSEGSTVIVRGKSPIYRDPANPIHLDASEVKKCDILLATHWGDDRMPIPAKMGGPVTLALSSGCKTESDNRRWVTFVEELELLK